ncbi:MAG: 4,5-dihydroxyphthalate decarboxylase [Rhodospirillales bacterium]|nr:4,5-dihydroxyphthalate decarboxylase [Rhodospirillales bacterium]
MADLNLSVAVGNYDRMRPLIEGAVQIDGVAPTFLKLDPEEIFFRAFRHADFDVCELSLSSFSVKTAAGTCPYVGVPVFPSRAFRHTSIYIRTDRGIRTPADLKGKRIGVPEYQLTANVWVRMFLEEDYGVAPRDMTWVRGGYENPGRVEKIASICRPTSGWRASRPERPSPAPAIRMSTGCSPIRPRPHRTGTARPASFRSCTCLVSAGRWSNSIPGCRAPP